MEKSDIKALTFDLFGTILDLGSSLKPYIAEFLKAKDAPIAADRFWDQWRARQRIEQYQDTLVMLGIAVIWRRCAAHSSTSSI